MLYYNKTNLGNELKHAKLQWLKNMHSLSIGAL